MIVTDLNELHQTSDPIYPEEYETVFTQLEEEIKKHKHAMGLSAPQIGIKKRAFVYWGNTGVQDEPPALNRVANPTIISFDLPKVASEEGCLSLPDIYCGVERYSQIEVSDDVMGHCVLTKDDARVYQHEFDHTNGVLIIDIGTVIPDRKIGRNEKCYCGSNKKFKKCHGK